MFSADQQDRARPGASDPSRFGPSAVVREQPAADDSHVLRYFADGVSPHVPERRQSRRFPAAVQQAWLGWWSPAGEFGTVPARLQDISLGGARLLAQQPPAVQEIVWLCLGTPDPTECVQAKVVAVSPNPGDDFTVRIAFGSPCPRSLYQMAIYGMDVDRAAR